MSGNIEERKLRAELRRLLGGRKLNERELMGADLSHMAAGGAVLGIVMAGTRMFALSRGLMVMVSLAAGVMLGDMLLGVCLLRSIRRPMVVAERDKQTVGQVQHRCEQSDNLEVLAEHTGILSGDATGVNAIELHYYGDGPAPVQRRELFL